MPTGNHIPDAGTIADEAGLPDKIGSYASMIVEHLNRQDYQLNDTRTHPAAVYVAARDEGVPITVAKVADTAGVDETGVAREYKRITDELSLTGLGLSTTQDFIERFADRLTISDEVVSTAVDLSKEGEDMFSSRSAKVSAALCLYAASRLRDGDIIQADFEDVGVSETSVRKGYKEVMALRGETPNEEPRMAGHNIDALLTDIERVHTQFDDVPDGLLERCREIANEVEGSEFLDGKSPGPIAAAIYWIAADGNRIALSQSEVADASGTHQVTVNRRVAEVRNALDQ